MPSPRRPWIQLVGKEWRELLSSRAWWVMLFLVGPLVGVTFIGAVRKYAEASGFGGTSAGVGEAFSPLDGIWVPTLVAYEIAATFLLPFVAIRLVAGDRQSGALKLELQHPMSPLSRDFGQGPRPLRGMVPGRRPGAPGGNPVEDVRRKHVRAGARERRRRAPPERRADDRAGGRGRFDRGESVDGGHPGAVLHGRHLDPGFRRLRARRTGGAGRRFTPEAMLDMFQHGLVELGTALAALVLIATGLGVAALWIRLGVPVRRRAFESAALVAAGAALVVACAFFPLSWDLSENRRHSFPEADQEALAQIKGPLSIEVHLAPEDPRRSDLENKALSKLRRVMPSVRVRYVSATSIGLFEQANTGYGEVWYELGGRRAMNRLTTEEAVLETIYGLAGVTPPQETGQPFAGHPLAAAPRGAAVILYGLWPAFVAGFGLLVLRRKT